MYIDPISIPIVAIVGGVIVAVCSPIARAYARRMDRGADRPSVPGTDAADIVARLERMEQAIDSIALEVERISEGQRFTTKLLAERSSPASAAAGTLPASASGESP
jgi:hypothetical protein